MAGKRGPRAGSYLEARTAARVAIEKRPSPHTEPIEALQWVINRCADLCRHAADKVDSLGEDELTVMTQFGPVDNQWIRLEERFRRELTDVCVSVEKIGLAERSVRLEEARAVLVISAIRDAAQEAGLTETQIRSLGAGIRKRLEPAVA